MSILNVPQQSSHSAAWWLARTHLGHRRIARGDGRPDRGAGHDARGGRGAASAHTAMGVRGA